MIVIKVELWSARTGAIQELARMHIVNDETTTLTNPNLGDYIGKTFRGRNKETLDKLTVSHHSIVLGWRRQQYHVWNLVSKMLIQMGYTQGH